MGLLDEAGGDFYRFNCFDLEVPAGGVVGLCCWSNVGDDDGNDYY